MTQPDEVLTGIDLIDDLERRFETETESVSVGGHQIEILRPRSSDALIREEDYIRDERLPYWADLWPSSRILAGSVIERNLSGLIAIELGCGLGIVTIAAMKAGATVLASDYYADALLFTRANAFRNLGRVPQTTLIDWRHWPTDAGRFDVMLASDVLYEREYASLLPSVIASSLAPGGVALIADPGRVAAPLFIDRCTAEGLYIREMKTEPITAGSATQLINVYEIVAATSADNADRSRLPSESTSGR
ncbi:MAG TPA: methyltransferase domain-containing protein [Gemmatimonadaceae bacterium]|jgi:predicted nicotinamide N-methyase